MKRIFFVVGLIIILLLTGILLFLLFASDSQKTELFNRFNLGNTDSGDIIDSVLDTFTGDDTGSGAPDALRQLTTKQVIGQQEILSTASSTTPVVYFAEAGTGHVYSLDVVSGTESRLSNITIQTAREAQIDRSGTYAVIASDYGRDGSQLTVITLPPNNAEPVSSTLPESVKDFTLTTDKSLLYSTITGDTLTIREFNIAKNQTATIFNLPFKEATVRFGERREDPILVYPKTAERLEGYAYTIRNGALKRLPISGYGLQAQGSNDTILYTTFNGTNYESFLYEPSSGTIASLLTSYVAEKCSLIRIDSFVCGSRGAYESGSVEAWYRGTVSGTDDLWLIDTNTYREELLVSPKETEMRDFDITHVTASDDLSRVYFINTRDNSLWLFERNITPVQ